MRRIKIPLGVKLFVAIWVAALCVPTVREIPRSLALFSASPDGFLISNESAIATDLAREFPDSPVAVGWVAQTIPPYKDNKYNQQVWREAHARFPGDMELRALQLRQSAGLFTSIAMARENKDTARLEAWKYAARIAREGGTDEPDNAFWPWMEAAFEFAMGDDEAAIKAFARVASCTRFNDYQKQTTNARLNFWGQHRAITWEDKLRISYSVFYSHFAALRDAAKLTGNRAAALKKSGDASSAIALESALLNGARLWRRDSDVVIGGLNAEQIATQSMEDLLGIPKPAEPGQTANGSWPYLDPRIHRGELARGWDAYVRKNGRSDLANDADYVGDNSIGVEFRRYWELQLWATFGMAAPWGFVAAGGLAILAVLALTIFVAALFWIPATLLRWQGDNPNRGQIAGCANFSFWLLLGLISLAINGLGISLNPLMGAENGVALFFFWFGSFFATGIFCWLLPVTFLNWKRQRRWQRVAVRQWPASLWNWGRIITLFFATAGALLIIANRYGVWDDPTFRLPLPLVTLFMGIGVAGGLLLELMRWQTRSTRPSFRRINEKIRPPRRLAQARVGLWLLFFVGAGALLRSTAFDSLPFDQLLLGSLAVAALVGAIIVSWRIARDHFAWQLARQTLGVLVLVWSVAFLVFSIGLMPLRAQLNRNLDRQIQIGEIAWMREQIAKAK